MPGEGFLGERGIWCTACSPAPALQEQAVHAVQEEDLDVDGRQQDGPPTLFAGLLGRCASKQAAPLATVLCPWLTVSQRTPDRLAQRWVCDGESGRGDWSRGSSDGEACRHRAVVLGDRTCGGSGARCQAGICRVSRRGPPCTVPQELHKRAEHILQEDLDDDVRHEESQCTPVLPKHVS